MSCSRTHHSDYAKCESWTPFNPTEPLCSAKKHIVIFIWECFKNTVYSDFMCNIVSRIICCCFFQKYMWALIGNFWHCLVWFDSLCPINTLSVKQGQVFLGWTSTKLGLMVLPKDTTQWRRWGSNPLPLGLESSTLPLRHIAPYPKHCFS